MRNMIYSVHMYAMTIQKKNTIRKKNISAPLLLGALIVVAFVIRILFINDIPAGIYPDEAVNGTDALKAWETKSFQWFYENNNGREGLYINLIALSTALFGNTIFGLKLISILAGTLTILGIYLLTKELYASRRAGLIAAFLMTFSFWAINFSRIGFRGVLLPLILVFSFYFLFQGIRTKRYLPFVFAGLIFGIGFHTYIAFRIAPVILIIIAIALCLSKTRVIQTYWKHALAFVFALCVTTAPMVYDFVIHPEHVGSRSGSISVLSPEVNDGDLWGTISKTVTLSIAKYFVWGDQNWRHNLPPFPILDIVTAIAFAIGIVWSTFRWLHLLYRRLRFKERDRELLVISFLLGWFTIMLAPEFLTNEGIPHALRAIGTQPPVFILAALPFVWLLRQLNSPRPWKLAPVYAIILFTVIAMANLVSYYIVWGNASQAKGAFDQIFTEQAYFLNKIPATYSIYVLANGPGQTINNGFPVSSAVIEYLTHGRKNITFLKDDTQLVTPAVFLSMRHEEEFLRSIEEYFGERAERKTISSQGNAVEFEVVYVD